MQLKASAPGSLMLLGEYAVLYGKPALVCAVDKRIHVTLTPRTDQRIEIYSSTLGHHSANLSEIKIAKPFHFVLGALRQLHTQLKSGCDIHIESEFSDKVGLGSSAAVTVATLAALAAWQELNISLPELVSLGREVVREIQGIGSGADVAASVYGGVVSYELNDSNLRTPSPIRGKVPKAAGGIETFLFPLPPVGYLPPKGEGVLFSRIEKFSILLPLQAIYAGFKTPTVEAIKHVQNRFANSPDLFQSICESIGQCAKDGTQFVRNADWIKLGHIMNVQQGMMESLGVNLPLLNDIVQDLRKQSGIFGAKISGSGLGDCVIGLGELSEKYNHGDLQRIPVTMTLQGVHCEKI